MAVVNIPAALRPLAGGAARAEAGGETLREVIDQLETQFPGLKARLVEGDRVRPGMAVFVNGTQAAPQLSTRVTAEAEIYFAPAIAGGAGQSARRKCSLQAHRAGGLPSRGDLLLTKRAAERDEKQIPTG